MPTTDDSVSQPGDVNRPPAGGPQNQVAAGPPAEDSPLFATGHLLPGLGRRSVRGAAATVTAQGLRLGLQILSIAVLARLLTPADFGLVAMVLPIVGFVNVFADAGLSMATIQRSEITHAQVSTLFWFNALLGAGLALITIGVSPAVAWFYGERSLLGVTALLSVPLLLTGLTVQHNALLTRQMRFGEMAAITVIAQVVSIVVGISLALLGASYWSLAWMAIANSAAVMVFTWWSVRWLPGRPRRGAGAGSMLAFGGNLTAFSFLNYFVRNLDNILVGWAWGKAALGFYSRAYSLLLLPITQFNGPACKVAMPALSRLQNDPERFCSYYKRGIYVLTALGMPMVTYCAVAAEDVVLLALGPSWTPTIPIFRALAPAAFCGTFNVALGWIFVPLGQASRQVRVGFFSASAVIIAFATGLQWGPVGVACGFSCAVVLAQIPMLIYTYSKSPVNLRDLGWALWPPATATLVAAVPTGLLLPLCSDFGLVIRLLCSGSLFAATYCLALLGLAKSARRALPLDAAMLRSFLGGGGAPPNPAAPPA